jgi:hypothetical protein
MGGEAQQRVARVLAAHWVRPVDGGRTGVVEPADDLGNLVEEPRGAVGLHAQAQRARHGHVADDVLAPANTTHRQNRRHRHQHKQ